MTELGRHDLAAPILKEPGEPKEIHETRFAPASTVLDVHAYVDDFNSSIVDAYRRAFRQSRWLATPRASIGVSLVVADTEEESHRL